MYHLSTEFYENVLSTQILHNLADKQSNRQNNADENINVLAEVIRNVLNNVR